MALAAKSIRELVPEHLLEEFDRVSPDYMEDPVHFPERVREPCLMKLELKHADIMVCLNSKVYMAYAAATESEREVVKKASKGLQHITNKLSIENYLRVLESKHSYTGTNYGFKVACNNARILQYGQQRSALTYFYCKRIVNPDGVTTRPLDL
jgi:hypothetical protein